MIAKIWSYSGWINNANPVEVKNGINKVLKDIVLSDITHTERKGDKANVLFWADNNITLVANTFPEDNCTAIILTATNEDKLYDFLSVLPDYFDILINDADNGVYPGQKTALMEEDKEEQDETQESEILNDLEISKKDEEEKVKVTISGKWMLHKFMCSEDYIKNVCHGGCCTGSDKVLISLLPEEAKRQTEIGCKVKQNKLCPSDKTGKCPHINDIGFCDLHFTPDKPFGCIASPFTLNKGNTLIIRYRYNRMKCHGSGDFAYKVFKPSLDLLFGKEQAKAISDYYDSGNTDDMEAEMTLATYKKLIYLDNLKH